MSSKTRRRSLEKWSHPFRGFDVLQLAPIAKSAPVKSERPTSAYRHLGVLVAMFHTTPIASPGTNEESRRVAGDLRRLVTSPDGTRYEIVGSAKDWKLGTGSVLLDAASFVWAAIRQARGKEWVVLVRRLDSKADPVVRRLVKTEEDAVSTVAELAEAIKSGEVASGDE